MFLCISLSISISVILSFSVCMSFYWYLLKSWWPFNFVIKWKENLFVAMPDRCDCVCACVLNTFFSILLLFWLFLLYAVCLWYVNIALLPNVHNYFNNGFGRSVCIVYIYINCTCAFMYSDQAFAFVLI